MGMAKLPEFVEQSKNYGIEWIIRLVGRYSEVLIRVFYITFKGE